MFLAAGHRQIVLVNEELLLEMPVDISLPKAFQFQINTRTAAEDQQVIFSFAQYTVDLCHAEKKKPSDRKQFVDLYRLHMQ